MIIKYHEDDVFKLHQRRVFLSFHLSVLNFLFFFPSCLPVSYILSFQFCFLSLEFSAVIILLHLYLHQLFFLSFFLLWFLFIYFCFIFLSFFPFSSIMSVWLSCFFFLFAITFLLQFFFLSFFLSVRPGCDFSLFVPSFFLPFYYAFLSVMPFLPFSDNNVIYFYKKKRIHIF